jgi:hypothetical protein
MFDPNAWQMPTYFTSDKSKYLRYQFKNLERITQNCSQCYQDMFVLSCLDGKTNGTYLEIGSGDPFVSNNTAILEVVFNWKGVSLDINPDHVENFFNRRKNTIAEGDATQVDYDELFKEVNLGPHFDYLQVDCEPPGISFAALKKIPLDKYTFSAITFEHDYYTNEDQYVRDESREYLQSHGYKLVVNNISVDDSHSFEDWWANPKFVSAEIISKMRMIDDTTKKAETYMLNQYETSE